MALLFSLLVRCLHKLSSFARTLTWRASVAPFASAAALTSGSPAVALPGQLDNTFATICPLAVCSGGRLFSAVGSEGNAAITAMALQPDGKIVVAGSCDHRITGFRQDGLVHQRICIERYRAPAVATDSWRDTTFGTNGLTISAPFRNNNVTVASIAVNSDGTILVAGTCTRTSLPDVMCVVRLLANGQLDGSFGTANAAASVAFPVAAKVSKMLLRPDGRILLVGQCGAGAPFYLCLAQLRRNGELDTDFHGNGLWSFDVWNSDVRPTGGALSSSGNLFVTGAQVNGLSLPPTMYYASIDVNGSGSYALTSDGFPNGVTTLLTSASAGIHLTPSGKLLIVGACRNAAIANDRDLFCLVRYLPTHVVDATFGDNGYVYTIVGTGTGSGNAIPRAVAMQPDGKIVVVGTCKNAADDFCSVRYHNDGTVDTSFDSDGVSGNLTTAPAANAFAVSVQPDGKILLGGGCTDNGTGKFCTVRLQGGPYGYKQCTMDIDGDGQVLGTTDAIIHARVAAGLSGDAVLNGLTFAPRAQRTSWPAIRDFLGNHCGMVVTP